jgi:hypothetical protein
LCFETEIWIQSRRGRLESHPDLFAAHAAHGRRGIHQKIPAAEAHIALNQRAAREQSHDRKPESTLAGTTLAGKPNDFTFFDNEPEIVQHARTLGIVDAEVYR